MAMKPYIIFFLTLFLTVLIPVSTVFGTYQLEYRIEVHADGSATWIIEHVFARGEDEAMFKQLTDPTYFSDTFVKNIKSLVNASREKTGRMNMTVEKFVMTASVLDSYRVVKYEFYWRGFGETEDAWIKIGDVFEAEGLFLYGEGTVNIVYPLEYTIESISPRPNAESGQTLTWYGIKDFGTGEPKIVLRQKAASGAPGFMEIMKENAPIIASLIALVVVSSTSLYYFKLRKKEMKEIIGAKAPTPPSVLGIEDDEEKVVNLLRAAGGSLYQSTIADHCGFSRSKTSKLLATMEKKGKIRREKKGREKVVTLIGDAKEFENTRNKKETYH